VDMWGKLQRTLGKGARKSRIGEKWEVGNRWTDGRTLDQVTKS